VTLKRSLIFNDLHKTTFDNVENITPA